MKIHHTMKYYTIIKKNKLPLDVTTWISSHVKGEKRQTQECILYDFIYDVHEQTKLINDHVS